jgi:tRNA(fMet)-specific endonuclease VapC
MNQVDQVTDNTGEFSRVAGLRVENWLRQTPAV